MMPTPARSQLEEIALAEVPADELESLLARRGVDDAQETELAQQVDRPIDRHEVDAPSFQPIADLRHGHGRRVIDEHVDDGLARAREAEAAAGHGCGNRMTSMGAASGHGDTAPPSAITTRSIPREWSAPIDRSAPTTVSREESRIVRQRGATVCAVRLQ